MYIFAKLFIVHLSMCHTTNVSVCTVVMWTIALMVTMQLIQSIAFNVFFSQFLYSKHL